jgi:putative ABC transport system permease protein
VTDAADTWRAAEGGDIEVGDGRGIVGFEDRLRGVEGVADVEGVYWSTMGIAEQRAGALGLPADTAIFGVDLVDGRWFTSEEEAARARVAVIGLPLAEITGLEVGDVVPVETPATRETFEIVGIDRNMTNDGKIVYLPIQTHYDMDLRTLPNWYWVRTTEEDESFIDGVATGIATTLDRAGYPYALEVNYIDANAARAEERLILGIVSTLGIPIVLIGMIGLASAMTMSVLHRTREIGILRSIGARAKDVRRMIRAEGLALAALGWVLALPLGYLMGWAMLRVIGRAFNTSFGMTVPYWAVVPSLVAALLLAVWIVRRPAKRAIRLSPGTALRYE